MAAESAAVIEDNSMVNDFNNDLSPKPNPIWKWSAYILLVGAALVIILSRPTPERIQFWIESYDYIFSKNLNWREIPFAMHQQELWKRNEMCARGPGEEAVFPPDAEIENVDEPLNQPRRFAAFTGMAVRIQACWNGDVLLRTVYNDGGGRAVWIAGEGFQLTRDGLGRAIAGAIRRAPPGSPDKTFNVICQEWRDGKVADSRVTRVLAVRTDAQEEADFIREDINILTGQVERVETVTRDEGCRPAKNEQDVTGTRRGANSGA